MKKKCFLTLLAAGFCLQAYAAENITQDEVIQAVLATARKLDSTHTNAVAPLPWSMTRMLLSPPPYEATSLPATNGLVLRTPPILQDVEELTLALRKRPGFKIRALVLIVEQDVPMQGTFTVIDFMFKGGPALVHRESEPDPIRLTRKTELVGGSTERFYRSDAPGPAISLRRKF